MSVAHAQKYYDLVSKDTALLESLSAGTQSADDFIARVVADAKKSGLEFSAEEAKQYLDEQSAKKADGELSDQQLEAVAGGKGVSMTKKCLKIFGLPWASHSWH